MVIGPWPNGGWASTEWPTWGPANISARRTAVFYREEMSSPLRKVSQDQSNSARPRTGSRPVPFLAKFDAWPPKTWTSSFASNLSGKGSLTFGCYQGKTVPYAIHSARLSRCLYEKITSQMSIEYMVEGPERFAAAGPCARLSTAAAGDDSSSAGPLDIDLWTHDYRHDADSSSS